jgi:predicted dehydrogenase
MGKKHILVIGAGSVGKRHLRNLKELGCDVSAMDPREDRLNEAKEQVDLIRTYTNFDSVINEMHIYDGFVIASPPKFHVQQLIGITGIDKPILMEKPLAPTYRETKQLTEVLADSQNSRILLGYSYRWWPPLQEFYRRLKNDGVSKPMHAEFNMSAHLADWHPWEQYQDFFMASKELGGGALLDESHFLDLMLWFFGKPERIFAKVERLSNLDIDTDDNVDIIALYSNGLRVTIHLDLYGRPHQKYISVIGEKSTLKWSFDPNCIQFGTDIEQKWDNQYFQFERNDMFISEAKEFLLLFDKKHELTCSLQDGIDVMEIIEACRESSRTEQVISLPWKG